MTNTNSKQQVSELLSKDLTDEMVVMEIMTHPRHELIIAGLIQIINNERKVYNEKIDKIMSRIDELELKNKNINTDMSKANSILAFMQNSIAKDNIPIEENKSLDQ